MPPVGRHSRFALKWIWNVEEAFGEKAEFKAKKAHPTAEMNCAVAGRLVSSSTALFAAVVTFEHARSYRTIRPSTSPSTKSRNSC